MVLPPSLKSFLSKISRIRRRVPDSSPPSRAHLRAMIYYHESVIRETESALAQKEVEIESALAQKEAEIAECRQHAADLIAERRQHVVEYGRLLNAEVPAIRLPAELLGEIFMEYMIGLRSPNDRENVGRKEWFQLWLKPTQICYHWRAIALSTPLLWSQLDTDYCCSPQVFEVLLSRSQTIPLDITLRFQTKPAVEHLDWVRAMLKESHRIRTLFINPTKISWKAEQCFTESVFTHLQHLRIDPQSYNTSSNLATAILQQPPPSLQTLTLVEVPINWNTLVGLPQTITSLYVKPSYPSDSDCADILDVLEGLPHLELLRIHGLPRVAAKPRKVVTLENLRECSLEANIVSANHLTQYLSLPSLTRFEESVSTTDIDYVYSGSEICELLLAMLHCYRRMTGMSGQFAKAHVKPFSGNESATVSFDINPCAQANQHDVSFTIRGPGWDSGVLGGVYKAVGSRMTPPIPTLSLSEAGSPILARTALQAEGVEILELCTLDSVFRLYPWFDFEDSAQDMVPFPALREVVWNPKPTTRTSDIRLIHNTLQKRHARGYTLPKLRIRMPQKPVLVLENSGSLESALTELRTVVNDLESD